jgi:hypothetical protein
MGSQCQGHHCDETAAIRAQRHEGQSLANTATLYTVCFHQRPSADRSKSDSRDRQALEAIEGEFIERFLPNGGTVADAEEPNDEKRVPVRVVRVVRVQ